MYRVEEPTFSTPIGLMVTNNQDTTTLKLTLAKTMLSKNLHSVITHVTTTALTSQIKFMYWVATTRMENTLRYTAWKVVCHREQLFVGIQNSSVQKPHTATSAST